MPNFQKTVLIIAVIVLIVSLVFIGIVLRGLKYDEWPPVVGSCPDYWVDQSPSGGHGSVCANVKNLGTCNTKVMNFNTKAFTGSNELCAKYNWATNCDVSWDGITYGVSNPCDDEDED